MVASRVWWSSGLEHQNMLVKSQGKEIRASVPPGMSGRAFDLFGLFGTITVHANNTMPYNS